MILGTSCDGGLLAERRVIATAPTLPPPSEPTDEQIATQLASALVERHNLEVAERAERLARDLRERLARFGVDDLIIHRIRSLP